MAEKKEKQYVSDNARLMAEWNFEKNNKLGLDLKTLTLGSNKKAWWKCDKGHEWLAVIGSRKKEHGCPYCAGQKSLRGKNDLQTINPKLASEWNFQKNNGLIPTEVMPNSGKKVWWKCEKGHEWQAVIASRNSGCGCPECAKQKRMKNKNKKQ